MVLAVAWTACGDPAAVEVPRIEPAVEAEAWACATRLGGRGVSGSPLVRSSLDVRRNADGTWLASYREERPTTIPSGLDLVFGAGVCGHVLME